MKPFTNLLFVMCIYHHCIGEDASWYKLLNGSITEVGRQCKNKLKGEITIFQDYTSRWLEQILDDQNGEIRIWNGYKYTSNWVENTGCFNKVKAIAGHTRRMNDMTVAVCERVCRAHGEVEIAIKESECQCIRDRNNPKFFNISSAHYCSNKCSMRPDEFCGSKMNSTFYNIYSVREPKSLGYPNITGNGLCLLYNRTYSNEMLNATNCDENFESGIIACRRFSYADSMNNNPIKLNSSIQTWTESSKGCIQSNISQSYLVSYSDVKNKANRHGPTWLNERKYTTTVEKMNNHEICEVLSKGPNGNVIPEPHSCSDYNGVRYVCKTGDIGNDFSTSTVPYQQNVTSTSRISLASQEGKSNSDIGNEFSASTFPFQQNVSSTSRISTASQEENINGNMGNELSTSTIPHQQNVSADSRISPDFQEENGSLIGGVIGAIVLVAVIGGLIFVFAIRMRHTGLCKEESQYQSQNVKYSKSNGIANMAYCSEATFDIIQGNPDRNSQENYMTIKDEDLQSLRNAKSEANKSADQNNVSPSDGPLYMVLEETKSLSEVSASIPNYEVAKPVPKDQSDGKENCEHNEENVEYDHLRQDAYKQAQEDAHLSADIADDYSHISQVTNVNEDNYTHTENYMHTCTPRNEEEDAYAHAQNNDYDSMVSEGDQRNSDPYDLAENVDNLQNDSKECRTDTFVHLDADIGNYSLAKPVDVSNGTQKG